MKWGCFLKSRGIKYALHLATDRWVHEFFQNNIWKDILMFLTDSE